MKQIRIAFFVCVVGFLGTLNGCRGNNPADIDYSNENTAFGYTAETETLFSEDLCVPTAEELKGNDSTITAKSSLIFDVTKQSILYADNIYQKLYPASITKIMTAYVALKYGNLDDTVTVGYNASHITEWGAKLCGFNEGDTIKLRDLLHAFLVYSGNDAGVAIAEHISGSVEDFADLMNQEANALGATHSHFVNPHGLHDDDHYTTAYDIYLIFNELIKNQEFTDIIHSKDVTVTYTLADGTKTTKTFANTNRYLTGKEEAPDGVTVIGGKTGTTSKAGSCLVLYSEDETGDDYISIVFKAENGDSLFYQMSELLQMIPESKQ